MNPCILFLTCEDQKEADKVAEQLLEKKLVSCVKFLPTNSVYRWKGKVEKANEILLIIDSVESKFDGIKTLLEKIHSYETFNLSMVKISKTTDQVLSWMKDEIIS